MSRPRVAVVGAGIAGLATAWLLRHDAEVVLFEADQRAGGHAHTVDITLDGMRHGVDTGFLVFNHATYPRLTRLFGTLGVDSVPAEMSFSVQLPADPTRQALPGALVWSGRSIDAVFSQPRNLVRPAFWGMLAGLMRFNRTATRLAREGEATGTLGEFLDQHRFDAALREAYLLPMLGCIWSCPPGQMLQYPLRPLLDFCHQHGLLRIQDRPPWFSVRGGSQAYVQRLLAQLPDVRLGSPVRAVRRVPPGSGAAGVWLDIDGATPERFDDVVLCCHTDQSLALLGHAASTAEKALLGAIRYQTNRSLLHLDEGMLPPQRRAWSAWNYEAAARAPGSAPTPASPPSVCLHYLINRLQPLPWQRPVIVSLNPCREPAPETVLRVQQVSHPVFDLAALAARDKLSALQGHSHTWFAGAWTGHGFHEDGLKSAMDVADALRQRWQQQAPASRQAAAA